MGARRVYADVAEKRRAAYAQRASALSMLKLERGCLDCGYDADPVALDFDHCRGVKKFTIAVNMQYSIGALLDEIEKCDVVCANCHRIRTAIRARRNV